MLVIQSAAGLFIFLSSLLVVTVLFSVMWYFHVKVALTCMPAVVRLVSFFCMAQYMEYYSAYTHTPYIFCMAHTLYTWPEN